LDDVKRENVGKQVHFGSLMALCHIKNSEQYNENTPPEEKVYKGRVVFRGDKVKDANGMRAVFTELKTTASLLAASKMMDVIARFPGCKGEDSDAVKAYRQVRLDKEYIEELMGVGGKSIHPETWISIPKDRQPTWWRTKGFKNPVVKLKLNLYGHPIAGLLWEKHCHRAIKKAGFEKIQGWEGVFFHREKMLFLSVYVDDFRMAGCSENMTDMWITLQQDLHLDPPVPSNQSPYLGCQQHTVSVEDSVIREKAKLFMRLLRPTGGRSVDEIKSDAMNAKPEPLIKTAPKKKTKASPGKERDGK
jgi:hypothetical protein